mgnify:CR=1 FL=1
MTSNNIDNHYLNNLRAVITSSDDSISTYKETINMNNNTQISKQHSNLDSSISLVDFPFSKLQENPYEINANDKDVNSHEDIIQEESTTNNELPPDKGYAWVVVGSVFVISVNTWGCNSAFGVFLSFFLSNNKFSGATRYDYALIAGLTVFLGQGLSAFALIIMRIIGLKLTMYIGTVIMAAAFVLASFATKLWHLYITQGFMIGVAIALVFTPATTLIPGWFLKRRALAVGLSILGTGAGGVTFSLASHKMMDNFGDTNMCYRMLAITCTVSIAIAVTLIKERKPVNPTGIKSFTKIKMEFTKMFSWKIIKKAYVFLIALWFILAFYGYNLMVFTLSSYAVARGMSQHQASSLTAILNGAQCVGRPIMGLIGDRYGHFNVTVCATGILCILMFGFWIPAHTYVQLIFFSIMMGLFVGVANVMSTVLISDMVTHEDFLPAWAFVNYSGSPSLLVTEVVAQALTNPKNKTNPYLNTQIFAGCCYCAALIVISILRECAVRLKLTTGQENVSNKEDLCETKAPVHICETSEEIAIKHSNLLGSGIKKYFVRLIYPMKI